MKSRILELDALRGIASISVVVFHFMMGRTVFGYSFKYGLMGVDMFFMISGFVIFLTLSNTKNWKDFIVSRFSRLYPTYWTCVTFTFLLQTLYYLHNGTFTNPMIGKYVVNLTMFQHYPGIKDLDPQYWTMIVEMNFYIIMLLIFRFTLIHKMETIGIGIVLFALFNDFYLWYIFPSLTKVLNFCIPLLNFFPLFLSGVLFYKLKFDKQTVLRYFFLAICFTAEVLIFNVSKASPLFITTAEYAMVLLVFFIVFFLYTLNLLKFIVNRLTIFLGSISYSLYLIHQNLGNVFIIPKAEKYLGFPVSFFIALITSILIAYLITRFIEQPALRFIRKKYKQHKARVTN